MCPSQHQHADKARIDKLMELFNATHIGLWEMDVHEEMTLLNPAFYQQLGILEKQLPFSRWLEWVHPEDQERLRLAVTQHRRQQYESYRTEYRMVNAKGKIVWIDAVGLAAFDAQGRMEYMMGAHIDVTLQKTYDLGGVNRSHVDPITGLPNRTQLVTMLDQMREQGVAGTLICLSFYNYQNRLLRDGQAVLDAMLKRGIACIEERLQGRLMIFRTAINEFVLLASNRLSEAGVALEIKHIQQALAALYEDFRMESEVRIASSFVDLSEVETSATGETLLYYGLLTLHEANRQSLYTPLAFSPELPRRLLKSIFIETDIIDSMAKGEIYNRYQPIYNRSTRRIEGFEALVRWQSKEWGEIYPDEFIQVCEQNRMIIELGRHVLRDALEFIRVFREDTDGRVPTVSVNISVVQLLEADFVDMVLKLLKLIGVAPKQLKLEVTESLAMESYPEVRKRLGQLRDQGIGISLDDFGTGYSSINNLILTPITELKIDRSIMLQAMRNSMIEDFIKSVVDLCHGHQIQVVGEGIEDEDMIAMSDRLGIDALQGYYFDKPLMTDEAIIRYA